MIKPKFAIPFISALFVLSITCPSIAYTALPADSIRVKWMDGKKFILHKIEPKETWLHLSRRYKCNIADLKAANEGVEQLKIGQIIKVPSGSSAVADTKSASKVTEIKDQKASPVRNETAEYIAPANRSHSNGKQPVIYVVQKGETMYSIARRYNHTVKEIELFNKLNTSELSEGQELIVGYEKEQPSPAIVQKESVPVQKENPVSTNIPPAKEVRVAPVSNKTSAEEIANTTPEVPSQKTGVSPASTYEKPTKSVSPVKKGKNGKTLMQVTETGVATWIQDGEINRDKYYALHRTAPIGTILKVTNRMNNQFVYVKVVGTLPDTGENENIIIKVSQAVSSKLVALDPLFQVELSYGLLN